MISASASPILGPLPRQTETEVSAAGQLDDLEIWRQRVFQFVLYLSIGFGFPPLLAWSLAKYEQGRGAVTLPIWGVYLLLVALAVFRRAPFRARAVVFLTCLFLSGSVSIVEYGFRGQGPFMYIAVVTMTVVFLGYREGMAAFAIALLVIGGTALLFIRQVLSDNAQHSLTSISPWVALIATFVLVGTSMLTAVGVLMRRLETSLSSERALVRDLRREVKTAKAARSEALRELTERKRAEQRLEQGDRVLHAVGFTAEKLLMSRRWEDCAEEVVRVVGEAAGVERVTLAEILRDPDRGDTLKLRYLWAAPGFSHPAERKDIGDPMTRTGALGPMVAALSRGEAIRIGTSEAPGSVEQLAREVSTTVATMLPVSVDGTLWGFIALASSDPNFELPEQVTDVLRAAAGSLGAAVGRDRLNAELEARVTERTERLAHANEELEAFSYTLSHDLRAPLRHVNAYIGMLREETNGALPEKALERMNVIADAASRMARMIDDLLQFYRLGRTSFATAELDLAKLVAEVIAEHEPETRARNVDWKIGSLPGLRADRALMKHVFANLIGNALKYTNTRSHAEIAVGHESVAGELVVYVKDNGVGFDPSQTHRLFHVFQRLHPLHDFEGNGIGLAHVRRIVERHGGRVWAKGAVDAGATIYLAFPAAVATETSTASARPA
jgi:signal transduction histidine kinase